MNIRLNLKTGAWRDQFFVFAASSMGLLLFELFFKWKVILSKSLILDDAFMFERAIHGRSFNDLAAFIPAFESADLDSSAGLIFYRLLADISNDIVLLRIIYLCSFSLACAIFGLLVYRITKDQNFSVLTAIFSFVTPFSPVLVLFTNGSYNIVYFILFFSAVLIGSYIRSGQPAKTTIWLVLSMTVLLLLSATFVETGFLFSFAAIIWLFIHCRAFEGHRGRLLFFCSGAVILLQAAWVLQTYSSPYEAMPGRVNYGLETMFLNGLSIINRAVVSYFDPMIGTGKLTLQIPLWVSIGFIVITLSLYFLAAFKLHRRSLDWSRLKTPLGFILFVSVCVVLSIGPYTALTRTHLWHYFPHMIFLSAMSYLLVYFVVSKRGAYLLIFVAAFLTVQTYSRQMPEYEEIAQQQKLFSILIQHESKTWRDGDRVVLIVETGVLGGMSNTFRSTGLNRYFADNPDAPIMSIVKGGVATRVENYIDDDQGVTIAYRMEESGTYKRIR
ncbi:hypothetical protein [Hyphomonas sp.]|uniref:hypothetical protein n=1 Tax=Hyphomonas sp. TaxID=87 RepID=UPI003D2DB4B3